MVIRVKAYNTEWQSQSVKSKGEQNYKNKLELANAS